MTTDEIQNQYSRAELAEALEISGNQILQYQERGLLADRSAQAKDIAYNSLDIARLRFILRCEAAGYHGNDVVDFIGKINKGANIKEQLKASLVHAHQKFSYVKAQKRKADILEQVNLQADADLIQKYIEEMKGIVSNPAGPPIALSLPKSSLKTASKQETQYNGASEQPTRYQMEPEVSSRLKAGLERSQQFKTEPRQAPPAKPSRPPASTAPRPMSPPPRPPARNKFIDSSDTSEDYEQRPDTPPDMFMDYSISKRQKSTAWKQTLITFLLLSAFSLAGYAVYVLKFQPPSDSSISNLNDFQTGIDDDSAEKELPNTLDQEDKFESLGNTPTENTQTGENESTASAKVDDNTTSQETESAQAPVETNSDTSAEQSSTQSPPTPTQAPSTETMEDSADEKSTEPESTSSYQAQQTDSSLSVTATKDLDDLLAKKQQSQQQAATDSYSVSDRPQVAVYDFKIFYQISRKILIAKFKMARIRPQRSLIEGRLFVVFKPRQSALNAKYFSVPDAQLADGIPTEPFKGIEFSFTESTKVQSVRTIYVRDPSQFDIATIFVFSKAGELVLRKEFTVDITEY